MNIEFKTLNNYFDPCMSLWFINLWTLMKFLYQPYVKLHKYQIFSMFFHYLNSRSRSSICTINLVILATSIVEQCIPVSVRLAYKRKSHAQPM